MIKPSGFQVWPREVEEVIAAHPAVAEVGVAGIPDAYSGEAVKAWVVLQAGQEVGAELQTYCRTKLAAYKVPKQIESARACQDADRQGAAPRAGGRGGAGACVAGCVSVHPGIVTVLQLPGSCPPLT